MGVGVGVGSPESQDTQYSARSRAVLEKKSTIGLDTKIRPVFVLISLVTQGAFESTGERPFGEGERSESRFLP